MAKLTFDSDAYFVRPYKKLIINYDEKGRILVDLDYSLFMHYR